MAKNKNSLGWGGILLITLFIGWLTWHYWPPKPVESMQMEGGLNAKFRTDGEQLEIYKDQTWQPFFVTGVNMGTTLPGHDPGELPIDKETYLRWFAMIGDMGANVIRVYTIQNPIFYDAIVEYNRQHPSRPLYFIQGVWSPEAEMQQTKDALAPAVREAFKAEIADAVGAVYGGVTIPKKNGKASGTYTTNAGPYLAAWHIGTEWDPDIVKSTNELHKGEPPYQGAHFSAKPKAAPFESFLAEMLDTLAVLESQRGWQHPQTFTNWVTTDPLSHPGELLVHEDMVSVDPTHIAATDWSAGYFASYHVYPYYPDLFRSDEDLQRVRNGRGETDSYLAYLRQLKNYHSGMPVMITEYGVPSSIGLAHLGTLGRDQGGHDETEQGRIDADLYQEIVQEKFAGAILFTWQDEWFKKTWNTMYYEYPEDRRKYWLNVLTNEEMFGVLGMVPSKEGVLAIDGDLKDWDALGKDQMKIDVDVPGWKDIRVTHDEGYVYVAAELTEDFDPSKERLYLGVDTTEGGNRHAAEMGNRRLDEGLETLITIGTDEESQVTIASNYDFHKRLYGLAKYRMIPVKPEEMKDDSGLFDPWKLAVGLAMEPPYSTKYHPFEDVTVGRLKRGSTDPAAPDYSSLNLWQAKGNVVEMRIPWMLLGFTDPSSLQVMGYGNGDGQLEKVKTQGIRFVPWMVDKRSGQVLGLGSGDSVYPASKLPVYTWPMWNEVKYRERLKKSYDILKEVWTKAAH